MNGRTQTVFTSFPRRPAVYLGKLPKCGRFRMFTHVLSSVFNDFGPKFTVVDPTGEEPLSGMIVSVDKVGDISIRLQTHALIDHNRTRKVL